MRRWSTRELVTLAVFGALWGLVEMTVGAMLHALHLPLTGMTMSALGVLVALTGYRFVPRRGAVLVMGAVAALLKAFSVGAVVLSPMLAIFAEAVLAEMGLMLLGGRPRPLPMTVSGALATTWTFFHPLVSQGLLGGSPMLDVFRGMVESAARLLHLEPRAVVAIIAGILALHAVTGAVAGALAFGLGERLARRLRTGTA